MQRVKPVYKSNTNSTDPDQIGPNEAVWSYSAPFVLVLPDKLYFENYLSYIDESNIKLLEYYD